MTFAQRYIAKNILFDTFIQESPNSNLHICVVIPCYNEPTFINTLTSLKNCSLNNNHSIEVIVVVNSEENTTELVRTQNEKTLSEIEVFKKEHNDNNFKTFAIEIKDIRSKWAGAGFARKIGMDEAVRRFDKINKPEGVIVSLDADCLVDENYFQEIINHSVEEPKANFWTIHFEHPINLSDKVIESGIINYELHMRYYRIAMLWSGYPNAIHTVGSAFAARAISYTKQGGMNRRKAGEDFYFLHKLIALGEFGEINSTKVVPDARLSNRVPFGTGPSLQSWVNGTNKLDETFAFEAFRELRLFFSLVPKFYRLTENEISQHFDLLPDQMFMFLNEISATNKIMDLQGNCTKEETFRKRFFIEFDAFFILQFLNAWHKTNKKQNTLEATKELLHSLEEECETKDIKTLLTLLRRLEKKKTKISVYL